MVNDLLQVLIDKQEFRGINKPFAKKLLVQTLRKHPINIQLFRENQKRYMKKQEYKALKTAYRKELRELYGVFFTPQYNKKGRAIKQLLANPTEKNEELVLSLHRSTEERLSYYNFLYHQLFSITGKPASVLDLGCGFNPFSYQHLPNRPNYHARDIACEDLELIDKYLTRLQINHSVECVDLTEENVMKELPATDVVFAFKLFDTLETIKQGITKQYLETIKTNFFVVSFPTLSIGQKKSISPREWFESLVTDRIQSIVTLPNEQFYIITGERT